MLLKDFQYELPKKLIAQSPVENRTGSRLMVVDRARGAITHDHFENFVNYLHRGDCLVLNDTRVMPARLMGRKTAAGRGGGGSGGDGGNGSIGGGGDGGDSGSSAGENYGNNGNSGNDGNDGNVDDRYGAIGGDGSGASVEALLLHEAGPDAVADGGAGAGEVWEAIVRPGKRLRKSARIEFGGGALCAEIVASLPSGHRLLQFNRRGGELREIIDKIGLVPLPPYIKGNISDPERYQTVYAKNYGSAAAPTAGLHFSELYLENIKNSGVDLAYLTLHIGPGTFAPVKTEIVEEHRMHSEYYYIGEDAAAAVNRVKDAAPSDAAPDDATDVSPRVVCVGTTSLRTLESAAGGGGHIRQCEDWTDLFIYPGYCFKCVDALLTNFHLPGSTLLMLVCAFSGYDLAMEAYRRAVEAEYRFFSFGDAMLIY